MRSIGISVMLILVLSVNRLCSQSIDGNWQGILTQKTEKARDVVSFAYWLELETKEDSVFGRARIEIYNSIKYGILRVKGTFSNNILSFNVYEVTEANIDEFGIKWCLINVNMHNDSEDGRLVGSWYGNKACGAGSLTLFRSNTPFNDNSSQINDYISLDELNQNIKESESVSRKKVVIEDIRFATSSIDLNEKSIEVLNALAKTLKMNKSLSIKILGHTDNVGQVSDNLKLSVKRAESVYNYLLKKGISEKRLSYEGFGETRPIGDNNTEEGRISNRRIEIEIN